MTVNKNREQLSLIAKVDIVRNPVIFIANKHKFSHLGRLIT